MNIFVGNLPFAAAEADVKKLFEDFGNVASVAIVMCKEKKAPKSRGFGFVEIQDEQQALAALAALNGREFMGRVLNISPARPKTEASGQHLALSDGKCAPSGQPGTYNGGRRTRSYMKRRGLAGMQEAAKPRRNKYDNPMRWRKKGEQPRPWEKNPGERRPWKKDEEGARPWKKSAGKPNPWQRPAAEAKSWSKGSAHPQKSRFNPSTSLGMVGGNGERSRTKSRGKPGGAAPGRKEVPAQ